MAKNIVFCADGTWNGVASDDDYDGRPDETNVLKLFHNLAGNYTLDTLRKADEQECILYDDKGHVQQIAKYLHGVGDSRNPITKLLGGVLGAGIIQRIVRGYTFVSRNYAPGAQIYLIGFSRGAYTVRALAGLISSIGLLDAAKIDLSDKAYAYRLGVQAWQRYRINAGKDLRQIGDFTSDDTAVIPEGGLLAPVPIRAVGVWDTVGSLGLPLYAFGGGRIDTYAFADQRLSANVQQGIHAVSIDELRADFVPTLWETDPRVEQVLFPGAHSDVGGGYPERESGLSDCALVWMSKRLEAAGLVFLQQPAYLPRPDPMAPAHTPWRIIAEFFPAHRSFNPVISVHKTVVERMRGMNPVYAPTNLQGFIDMVTRGFLTEHVRVVE